MGFNWGGFASGVGSGLNTGMQIGTKFKAIRDQAVADDVRKQAVADAAKEYGQNESLVAAGGIKPQSMANEAMPTDGGATYQVDMPGQPAPEKLPTKKDLGSLKQFTAQKVGEQLEQHYIQSGNMDEADAWGKWRKDKANDKKMEDWAEAYQLNQAGDYMGSAKKLIGLHGHYADGFDVVSATPFKDAAGRDAGFDIVYKDAQGKQNTMKMDAMAMSNMGVAQLNPQALFQMDRQQQLAGAAARVKSAEAAANDARELKKSVAVEGVKAGYKAKDRQAEQAFELQKQEILSNGRLDEIRLRDQLDRAGVADEQKAKVSAKINTLREYGYGDADIAGMVPALIGIDGFKKGTSRDERRGMIVTEMAKDPMFSRLADDEKKKRVDSMMSLIPPDVATPKPSKAPSATTAPAAGGARPGLMIYDPLTKKMISAAR